MSRASDILPAAAPASAAGAAADPTERFRRVLRVLPNVLPLITFAMAALVLVGWRFDVELFKSLLHGGRVAMNPVTSCAFMLSAVSFWLQRRGRPASGVVLGIARAAAAIVVAVAVLRLGAYLEFWKFRPDAWLFSERLHGNVIAPNTALGFLLLGGGLLIYDVGRRGRFRPAQALLLGVAAIATLSLTGYLYNIAAFYGVKGTIPMSLNSAINFMLLSVAALAARPNREPLSTALSPTFGGVLARRLLPATFLIPLLLGALAIEGWQRDYYDVAFGMTLFVLSVIAVFNVLVWWSARVIHFTEAKREGALAQLRLSEQRYHAIMRQAIEGIYLVDLASHRVVETNPALEQMLGYTAAELQGRPIVDLINDEPDHVLARLASLREARQGLLGERQYRRKDGSIVEVFAGATVISYGGRDAACTVVHDVTARNRAQRMLQEKHDQLEKAVAAERAALEQLRLTQSRLVQSEKLASLGQMVAGVAHEINNPLSFVSNNVAVLQRDATALCELIELYGRADETIKTSDPELLEEIRDLAERMDLEYTRSNLSTLMSRSRDGLKRIQQIVKDLRDFARLDESDLHEVDLNAGITSTLNIIVGRAKKKRVELKSQLDGLPLVTCYPAKINQVVMNLVANAIDASPEGGAVTIRSSRPDAGHVRISVSDQGPGVPAAIRDRIFDPFFTTKPQGEGTGLGLSISYGIVNDHGGTIDISDAPDGGAVFTVTLPVVAPAPPPSDHRRGNGHGGEGPSNPIQAAAERAAANEAQAAGEARPAGEPQAAGR